MSLQGVYSSPPERVERTQTKPSLSRAKTEDTPSYDSPSRRPGLFETRHISRGSSTVPDDIVLGPPKTAFASATSIRTLNKSVDSPDRPSYSTPDDDNPRNDRMNFRDRLARERERGEREGDKTKEIRQGTMSGRRIKMDEGEGWTSVRSRKSFGHEEGERMARRTTDRDRDREFLRDGKERLPRTHENFTRDKEREIERGAPPRRNGVPRGRNETSWFRNDDAPPPKDRETRHETRDSREWRDREQTGNREWPRGGRIEKDPEWMDAPVQEEKKQAHTAEDFQRWKERMKAGNTPADERSGFEDTHESHQEVSASAPPETDYKDKNPIVMDAGVDKFFTGLWNEPKQSEAKPSADLDIPAPKKQSTKATVGKASRFTSFFSPSEGPMRDEPETPPPIPAPSHAPKDSSTEDKEGFQRILQMLGGKGLEMGGPTPPTEAGPHSRSPRPDLARLFQSTSTGPPDEKRSANPARHSQQRPNPDSRSSTAVEQNFGQQPSQGVPPNRNSEFLFSLMQQPAPSSESDHPMEFSHRYNPEHLPADISGEALFHMTQGTHPSKMPAGRDDPKGNVPSRPPPGFFDDPSIAGYSRPQQPQPPPPENMPIFPPGQGNLQRPPGFEQISSPAWAGSQYNPPPRQRAVPPPPGLNSESGNRNSVYSPFVPGPPPPPPGMSFPLGNGRRPGVGSPTGPPGMPSNVPPPGFFNMGGPPPPGYPPGMPFQMEGGMGGPLLPGGRPGGPPFSPFAEGEIPGSGGPGRGPPPPGQYRH
ncbi:MAG: hypothetical protein M4579_005606 [Chaenotheca gracillima]|nr:MAG: hypothetical protein M4579_005606 [Chaenotheca gracillima]